MVCHVTSSLSNIKLIYLSHSSNSIYLLIFSFMTSKHHKTNLAMKLTDQITKSINQSPTKVGSLISSSL